MTQRHLQNWLSAYLEYTENSEPPLLYRKWVAISAIAACLQRKCYLNWGFLTFYPNMYIVLVGPSGIRKGTAMGPAYSLLREMGLKMAAESITREALIRELKQSNDTLVDPKTGEMHMHASLTIYSQELTVFLGYNNLALMSDLTDWYDCRDQWTYRTKNMGTDELIGVWVNLIGATTPDLVQSTMPMDAIGGGLTSRIIFIYADKKAKLVATPFLSQREKELKPLLLADLERIRLMSGQFRVTQGFLDAWISWYHTQALRPPFDDTRFSGYIERRPNHILKLCIIMNAARADGMQVITEHDLTTAIEFLQDAEREMPLTFSGVGKSPTADITGKVMQVIQGHKEIALSRLMQLFYHDADKRGMETVIQTMEMMKVIKVIHQGTETIIRCVKGDDHGN